MDQFELIWILELCILVIMVLIASIVFIMDSRKSKDVTSLLHYYLGLGLFFFFFAIN
jgi:hypothetical protein